MSCALFVGFGFMFSVVCIEFILSSTLVVPERAEIYYVNEKYLSNVSAFIRRTSRKSPYYINVQGTSLVWLGDNVTLHGTFYEFLHNEYKRSFVEIEMKMCDLVNKDPWRSILGESLASRGLACPAPPGTYDFSNVTASMRNVPYKWPFDRVMFQAYAKWNIGDEIIVRARFYASFKHDVPKGK